MRHFKIAWRHIRRSPYQALAAILVMTLTFFLASVFLLTTFGFQAVLQFFETRPQVSAFFKDDVKVSQVEVLKTKLQETGKVSRMKYISKEEALAIYKEQIKNDPLLLEMVTASILPASLEVSTNDLANLKEIAQLLKEEKGVEDVIYQEDVVTALSNWTSGLRIFGAGLISFLTLTSLLIILVVIGMKIALRKEEIEISRLVGASSWYIRAPFVLEGVFYGLIGALFGWIVSYLLLLYATPFLTSFLAGIPLLPVAPIEMAMLLFALMGGGIVLGISGSLLAIGRYLK